MTKEPHDTSEQEQRRRQAHAGMHGAQIPFPCMWLAYVLGVIFDFTLGNLLTPNTVKIAIFGWSYTKAIDWVTGHNCRFTAKFIKSGGGYQYAVSG